MTGSFPKLIFKYSANERGNLVLNLHALQLNFNLWKIKSWSGPFRALGFRLHATQSCRCLLCAQKVLSVRTTQPMHCSHSPSVRPFGLALSSSRTHDQILVVVKTVLICLSWGRICYAYLYQAICTYVDFNLL
jgi:hypothetical protein